MKEIHKIQVKINGIPVIALVDDREAYSFVTTTFIKGWNLKVKRSFPCKITSPNGLIIGQAKNFPISINNLTIPFSMDMVSNHLPIIMLGKDWLKFVKARHTPLSEALEINYQRIRTWTRIVGASQEFEEYEEMESIIDKEFPENFIANDELLINLDEENITPALIQPSISKDVFQIDIEHFQQEFDQNSIDSHVSNETEEMPNVDEILDEIVQMYQEIIEEPVEEKSNILGEMSFNDIASENSITLVTEELSDDFKLNIKSNASESKINKPALDLEKVDQEHCQYEIKENIIKWILQQQPMQGA
jgi:hypothetical protein